jgi:hypothetical protein
MTSRNSEAGARVSAGQTAAPRGGTFLERALERALASLDVDRSLSETEREAAKAALSAALACEIRDMLAGARTPATAARALAAAQGRPFARAPGAAKRGYFREPAEPVGVAEAGGPAAGQPVRLTGGTATWLRLAPAADPGRTWTCAALKAAMRRGGRVLPIFGDARGTGELRAEDGFGIYAMTPGPTESSGVVFAFRTGEVWAVDTYVQDALAEQRPNRAIRTLAPQLVAAFEAYGELMVRLGVAGPWRWEIGMDGLLGRSMALEEETMAGLLRGESVVNTVVTEGEWDGAASPEEAIQPFFDDLLKACSTPVG